MKLLYCPQCGDVRKLSYDKTFCKCGKSWGYYEEDGLNAVVGGYTIPLGISNSTLRNALDNRPVSGLGSTFEAFVIPRDVPTIRRSMEDAFCNHPCGEEPEGCVECDGRGDYYTEYGYDEDVAPDFSFYDEPEATDEDEADDYFLEAQYEALSEIEQGMYDDDPNPYDGTYSEE